MKFRSLLVAAALIGLALPGAVSAQNLNNHRSSYNLLDTSKGDFVLNQTTIDYIAGVADTSLPLTSAKGPTGIPLTAAAGTPTGAVGISRTAGTSLQLVGEATSSNAKTDVAFFEFNLPSTYIAGNNVQVIVNAGVAGSGTLTGASTTMTTAFYTEVAGVEAAQTVSAAQQIVAAGSDLTFTVTGTNLLPGQRVAIQLSMLVTTSSGANTGQINGVRVLEVRAN